MTEEEYDFEGFLEREKHKKMLSFDQLRELARLAHSHGIAVASHDDDTREKLDLNREIGVDISEFPITIPAAQYAKSLGFYTVVGAPNILRGGSHSGNMSAAEAVQAGCADILCSDYYPPAILHGVFLLHSKYGLPLPEVVRKATRNPALAVGLPTTARSPRGGRRTCSSWRFWTTIPSSPTSWWTAAQPRGSSTGGKTMAILSIEHLSKEFYIHNAQKRIRSCQDITLRLQEGEFIGIVGLSGAGKSTNPPSASTAPTWPRPGASSTTASPSAPST